MWDKNIPSPANHDIWVPVADKQKPTFRAGFVLSAAIGAHYCI
jgi:hypothetical protein